MPVAAVRRAAAAIGARISRGPRIAGACVARARVARARVACGWPAAAGDEKRYAPDEEP